MDKGSELLSGLMAQAAAIAPKAALVLGILFGGLILSSIARRVAGWAVRKSGLETLVEKAGAAKLLYKVGLKDGITSAVQAIVWYGGLLITAASLAEVLGLGSVQEGISAIMAFLPRVIAGVAVLVAGLWLAGFLRGLVERMGQKEGELDSPTAVGQVVYFAVLTVTATMALDQAGIEICLMNSLLQLAMGAAMLAMALAFALGGRAVFGNLIARHYYHALVRPGDKLRLGDVEGTVVRVSSVAVIVATSESELVIPCSTLMSQVAESRRMGGASEDD